MNEYMSNLCFTKIIKIPSTKNQISNKFQKPKFENSNKRSTKIYAKQHSDCWEKLCSAIGFSGGTCFGHWILRFVCYLVFGVWDFGTSGILPLGISPKIIQFTEQAAKQQPTRRILILIRWMKPGWR
jgi:hypothetical protein